MAFGLGEWGGIWSKYSRKSSAFTIEFYMQKAVACEDTGNDIFGFCLSLGTLVSEDTDNGVDGTLLPIIP